MGPLGLIAGGLGAAAQMGGAALQNRWARKAWERQNAYNHPKAQMDRLREAGLSPNLMYSAGKGGHADTAGQQATSNINPAEGVAQGLQTFMAFREQREQLQNMGAERELLEARKEREETLTQYQGMENQIKQAEVEAELGEYGALGSSTLATRKQFEIQGMKENNENVVAQRNLTNVRRKSEQLNYEKGRQTFAAEVITAHLAAEAAQIRNAKDIQDMKVQLKELGLKEEQIKINWRAQGVKEQAEQRMQLNDMVERAIKENEWFKSDLSRSFMQNMVDEYGINSVEGVRRMGRDIGMMIGAGALSTLGFGKFSKGLKWGKKGLKNMFGKKKGLDPYKGKPLFGN